MVTFMKLIKYDNIRIIILSYLGKKYSLTTFIRINKKTIKYKEEICYRMKYYDEDYNDIINIRDDEISFKILKILMFNKNMLNRNFDYNNPKYNVIEFIIRKNYVILLELMKQNLFQFIDVKYLKYALSLSNSIEIIQTIEFLTRQSNINNNNIKYILKSIKDDDIKIYFIKKFGIYNINDDDNIDISLLLSSNQYDIVFEKIQKDNIKNIIFQKKNEFEKFFDILILKRYEHPSVNKILEYFLQILQLNKLQITMGITPLLRAIKYQQQDVANFILNYITIPDISSCNNRALRDASENGWTDVVAKLIKLGSDPSYNKNNALSQACRNCHIDTIKILLNDQRVLKTDKSYAIHLTNSIQNTIMREKILNLLRYEIK